MNELNKFLNIENFSVDYGTTKILIVFSSFCNNDYQEEYASILEWLNFDDVILNIEELFEEFILNGNSAIEVKNVYFNNRYDLSIILPKVFNAKENAIEWYSNIIKNSNDINKYKLDNIELIDANKFIDFINNNVKLEF